MGMSEEIASDLKYCAALQVVDWGGSHPISD